MLKPNNVFRPGKLPIHPGNIYASRGKSEENFKKILSRGLIPLVYGEYGVGKTSMARYAIQNCEPNSLLVTIESVADKTLSDIFSRCLEKIGYRVDTSISEEKSTKSTRSAKTGFSVPTPWLRATFQGTAGEEKKSKKLINSELLITSPTDSKFIEICEDHSVILLLDEMHKATEEFVDNLSTFIKAYGNASCNNFKIAILGTSSDPSRLVLRDPGVDRLIEEVHLEAMTPNERAFLVTEGMRQLAIHANESVVEQLCTLCVGSPNILQWLCLEAAELAFKREPRKLEKSDISVALEEYAQRRESRLYRIYMAAIENKGAHKYRKQILRAMSESENEYTTMDQIREKVCIYLGNNTRSSDLSGPLRTLKEQKPPIITDIQKSDGEGRIQNYNTFVDPALKAYIRMLAAKETIERQA